MSDSSKPLIQIINDHLGFIHPGGLPILFDTQARHFDFAALFEQRLAILRVVLRVFQRYRHVQAMQGAAGFHAERAGVELVQRKIFRGRVDLSLSSGGAFLLARAGNEIGENNQLAEADTKRFDEHVESLTVQMKKGAQLTRFFTGEKKPAINAGSFLLRIT
ncbi:hypothetical protein ABIA54_000597 [Pseudomonas sp. EB276 TE3739]|nr:hypothetical protein [Pseudomonas koreensis]